MKKEKCWSSTFCWFLYSSRFYFWEIPQRNKYNSAYDVADDIGATLKISPCNFSTTKTVQLLCSQWVLLLLLYIEVNSIFRRQQQISQWLSSFSVFWNEWLLLDTDLLFLVYVYLYSTFLLKFFVFVVQITAFWLHFTVTVDY